MEKFALLKLEKLQQRNNLESDLSLILQLGEDNLYSSKMLEGKLASSQPIVDSYQTWQVVFKQLLNELKILNQVNNSRAIKKVSTASKETLNESESKALAKVQEVAANCRNNADYLVETLNNWLNSKDLHSIITKLSELITDPFESSLIIQAEDLSLLKLPWHLWNHFGREVTLSTLAYQKLERPAPKNPRTKVRILAIFGDDKGINIEQDRQNLARLTNADIISLDKPQRKELYEQLWDEEGYDILFFAGHSSSQLEDEKDVIFFNSQEKLEINKLKEALRAAIGLGLKLAIFNSCDGLGLGQKLADLNIPQVIVMREEVPNLVAQTFLKYFLEPFAGGQSLSAAMQQARRGLKQDLDTRLPGASWLPVIWQNPTEIPLTWQNLTDLRAEPTWRGCCRAMLVKAAIQRLGNNMLAAGEGMGYELEEIYVPLGLVERKKSERRREDVSPETGSQLYQPELEYEVTKVYQQQEFFEEVLDRGNSPKSQGRRLVLIGEPGAGKTTLLQKIGNWVLDSTTEAVPIWISLADLQGQSLASYLRENWLEKAMSTIQVPEGNEDGLRQLFQSGRVWLLLDGVDELSTTSANPIVDLVSQLITGWVTEARLVLTCRLNLWETAKDTLEDFDVYRNLDFSYGDINSPEDQVKQFVDCWFNYNRTLGSNLRSQLDDPGRERIRDLVKNPLRLSLLCRTWQWQQGSLPRTKAELYRQFTEAVYQWKQNIFPTTTTEQEELNRALSRLAKKALSQPRSRFRLASNLVLEELGEFDSPMFQRALQIGWINQVGVAAENPSEKVYAFFHPTFQEYFAARAIADWHDFLTHDNNYPARGIYRVFEPQWRETILLWLGREDIPHQTKEEFFEALLNFQDGCEHFYQWQSYLLVAAGIAEFWQYTQAEELITRTANWCCCGSIGIQDPNIILSTIREEAKLAMRATDRSMAIEALTNLLNQSQDLVVRFQAAQMLGELAPNNLNAIEFLIDLISEPQYVGTYLDVQAAEALEQIGIKNSNSTIIDLFEQRIRINQDESTILRLARCLGKIEPGNSEAINTLIHIAQNSQQIVDLSRGIRRIEELDANNPSVENDFVFKIARNTGQMTPVTSFEEAKQIVINQMIVNQFLMIRQKAIMYLGEIGVGNPSVVNLLIDLIRTYQNNLTDRMAMLLPFAIANLGKVAQGNSDAIDALNELLHIESEELRLRTAESLVELDSDLESASACLTSIQNTSRNDGIRLQAAQILRKINPDRSQANQTLTDLTQNSSHHQIMLWATDSLEEDNSPRSEVIDTLTQRLRYSQDENMLRATAESLGRLNPGNLEAVDVLINLLRNGRGALIPYGAVSSLKKILQKNLFQITVSRLRDFSRLSGHDNNIRYGQCYDILWYCAKNLAYPDFYQAFYHQPLFPLSSQILKEQINAIAQQRQNTTRIYPMLTNPERFAAQQEMIGQLQPLLRVRKIALIFYACEPNPELVEFYQELIRRMPRLYIGWITSTILPPPLRAFSPREPNLINTIQSWLDEID